MKKALILSAVGLAVLLVGASCKKKKEEVVTDSNESPSVTVTAAFETVFSSVARTNAPAPSYAIALSATASDKDGSISKVEFYLNGEKVAEDLTAPYEASTSTTEYENDIYAIATDNDGATTKSETISLDMVAVH